MKKAILAALALMPFAAAHAGTIVHEDSGDSFRTFRGAGSAPVGRLEVTSAQSISGFGIDVDLDGDSTLNFLIFNSTTGALLYQSGPKAFTDNGAGYKFSDAFSFTFQPGTTYGLTASNSLGGNYFVDFVPNTVGAFNFLIGNQNVNGTSLDTTTFCCDVGTALVTSAVGTPEPSSWVLMITGFGFIGGAVRLRHRRVAAA